jgi:hypothetical protein
VFGVAGVVVVVVFGEQLVSVVGTGLMGLSVVWMVGLVAVTGECVGVIVAGVTVGVTVAVVTAACVFVVGFGWVVAAQERAAMEAAAFYSTIHSGTRVRC